MSHELSTVDGKVAFIDRASRGGPAWHRLGEVFPESEWLTVRAGAARTGADRIHFEKVPYAGFWQAPDGRRLLVQPQKKYMLCRLPIAGGDDQLRYMDAEVSEDYEIIPNLAIAKAMDQLGMTKRHRIETMGLLGEYADRWFVAFAAEMMKISGRDGSSDAVKNYYMLVNYADGRHAASLSNGAVRPVCANTIAMHLSSANLVIKIPHLAGAGAAVTTYMKLLTGLKENEEELQGILNTLAAYDPGAGKDDVVAIKVIDAAFPLRQASTSTKSKAEVLSRASGVDGVEISGDAASIRGELRIALDRDVVARELERKSQRDAEMEAFNTRQRRMRAAAQHFYQVETQHDSKIGPLHRATQAVVEACDWVVAPRQSEIDRVADATIDGDRLDAKSRAYKQALAIAGVK